MLIPNAEKAVVDIAKLRSYCLCLSHPQGKDKARLFQSILGITESDAEGLRNILLEIVKTQEAQLRERDEYGQRYTLNFDLTWNGR